MGRRPGKAKGRSEPRFDAFPVPAMNLRLSVQDRPAGPPPAEAEPARRRPAARKDSRAVKDDKARPSARRSEEQEEAQPARKRPADGGGGKRRSLLRRLVYWAIVIGLWVAIAVLGTVLWIAAHLPPIQSLEIP